MNLRRHLAVLAIKRAVAISALLLLSHGVLAQADLDLVPYTIKTGDTLSSLAKRYLIPPPELQRIRELNNLADIDVLREGDVINFQRRTLLHTPSMASIAKINCRQSVSYAKGPLSEGDQVGEGDILQVPKTCSIHLVLEDGSTVLMPAGGRLQINLLRKNALDSTPVIRMQISGGFVEVNVNKQIQRTAPFEITTPTVVMGVRGTGFRVRHSSDEDKSVVEVLSGSVGVSNVGSQEGDAALVGRGRGLALDSAGGVQADEALLPPSRLSVVEKTDRHIRLFMDAGSAAAKHWITESALATFTDTTGERPETESSFWLHRPTKEASFVELIAESDAGIRGYPARYGVCESSDGKCDVWFENPLLEGLPTKIEVNRIDPGQPLTIVVKPDRQLRARRFAIRGLPAGRYEWRATEVNSRGEVSQSPERLQARGAFELIAIP